MSVDTNLHRTFDYQLSPAPLRIIDWAPVKSVAASVLQSGPTVKTYNVVDSTSSNEATLAAAYVRQETERREAARARVNVAEGSGGAALSTEYGLSGASAPNAIAAAAPPTTTTAATVPAAALPPLVMGQADPCAMSAASPYYTPGMFVSASHEGVVEPRWGKDAAVQPQQPQQYGETWTAGSSSGNGINGNDVAAATAAGGAGAPAMLAPVDGGIVTPTAAAAATGLVPAGSSNGVNNPVAAAAVTNGILSHHNSIPNTSSNGNGTPKAGAAAIGVTPRVRASPSSSSSSSSMPALARYRHEWDFAGNMYGFDSVYQNGSFGVLLGLFTGVGYQQTNVFYRQEDWVVDSGKGKSGIPAATATTTAAGAGPGAAPLGVGLTSSGATGGGSNPGSASNSVISISPSENTVAVLPVADGSGGLASVDGPMNSSTGSGGGGGGDAPPVRRARMGPVIAHRSRGGFQLCNAIQCFWYWGARRWTGVFNLRFTPLLSGGAVLPVCEFVSRTAITENSILIDDPVVYIHSFVVMLGRRKRTPDDVLSLTDDTAETGLEAVRTSEVASHNGTRSVASHSLVAEAARRAGGGKTSDSQNAQRRSVTDNALGRPTERSTAASSTHAATAAENSSKKPSLASRGEAETRGSGAASVHKSSSSSSPTTAIAGSSSASAVAAPVDHHGNTAAATDDAKAPSWYYWYQRCMLDTSDEWLWNRAASEVAAAAAQSTTPWWRLRHVKTGVGLSYRYRKPGGINVYWGWSAQLGRGTSLSGHVDVLRRMSCSISSSFGFLDLSVRLRVNLVTLHRTALDAGLCWRPLPHVPELAVRVATSANGTTLGLEVADVAPRLYAPLVERLVRYRAQQRPTESEGEAGRSAGCAHAVTAAATATTTLTSSSSPPVEQHDLADGTREDLVGLLPVTWHYLRGLGSTVTHAYTGVVGAIASTWQSKAAADATQKKESSASPSASAATSVEVHGTPALLPVPQTFSAVPPAPSLATAHSSLSGAVLPLGRAGVRYVREACRHIADLGWLETMLRTSHVNVSMGITAEPGRLTRDWSCFLILSEK